MAFKDDPMMPTLEQSTVQAKHPVLMQGIAWDLYETLRAALDAGKQRLYLTYSRGALEIMPPSPFHEKFKTVIGRFIEMMSLELGIGIASFGSTTFKRSDLERGLEPDECYYIRHEARMASKLAIDLAQDPPPDLALEMDYTHHEIDREEVYAALGFPELWVYDGTRLIGLALDMDGKYRRIGTSIAFPFLQLSELERFLLMAKKTGEMAAVKAFAEWIGQFKKG